MNKEMETYFEQNATDGVLSDDAMAKLLVGDMGDTATAEAGEAPAPAPADEVAPEPQPDAEPEGEGKQDADAEAAGEEQVVLAKDGKNIIPYDKLVEARNEAKAAREANNALMQEMESIKAQIAEMNAGKVAEQHASQEKMSETVDVAQLERDWHEAVMDDNTDKAVAIRSQINAEIKRQALEEASASYAAQKAADDQRREQMSVQQLLDQAAADVAKQYPELDLSADTGDKAKVAEVVEYRDFLISSKGVAPHEALQQAAKRIMGAPVQQAKPVGGDTPTPKAEAKVKTRTPTTMSDIPAGTVPHHDEAEALMQMSNTALLGKMMSMDPNKIADLMARLV